MSDPTLSLSPTAQKIYAGASADPSVGPSLALAAAQKYDSQKADSASKIASLGQQAQGFRDDASKFGNGSTAGALGYTLFNPDSNANLAKLAPIAAIPFTGGLSLLGTAAAIGGSAAAGELGRQAGNIAGDGKDSSGNAESFDPLKAGEEGLKNAASTAIGGKVGEYAGKALGSAAGKVGDLLGSKAEDLAVGSLGITKSQSGNFWQKTGQKLGDFIQQNGLIGKSADDVSAMKDSYQQAYNSIARESGVQVLISDVRAAFDQNVARIEGGVSSQSKQAAQAARDELETAIRNLGVDPNDAKATVDIGDLANAKSEYQNNVTWNSPKHDQTVAGVMADTFLDTINKAAGDMTDAQGNSLKQIGQKLKSLNILDQWAQKAANTSAPAKGPWTLGNVLRPLATSALGTAAAGPVGTVLGAGAGVASDLIASSPAAIRATSNLYSAGSGALGNVAGALAGNLAPQTAGSVIGAVGGALNGGGQQSSSQPTQVPSQDLQSIPQSPQNALGDDLATQAVNAIESGQPMNQSQYQALLSKDLARTGGRFQDKITAAYNAGNPQGVQALGTATGAAGQIADLYSKAGGGEEPILGALSTVIGKTGMAKQDVQAYNQSRSALGQEIVSQIYGSSGTADDRDQILNMIPLVTDSPQVAATKLATLKATIAQRVSSMTGSTPLSVTNQASGVSLNLGR